jgi:hypothetical protein
MSCDNTRKSAKSKGRYNESIRVGIGTEFCCGESRYSKEHLCHIQLYIPICLSLYTYISDRAEFLPRRREPQEPLLAGPAEPL